jgi:O-antigen/teichoic acid export membrane protein
MTAASLLSRWLARPLARTSAMSLVIRLAGLTLGFLQAILCARLLGVEGYGTFALSLAVAQIAATFALLGLHNLAVCRVAELLANRASSEARRFAGRALGIATVAGLALSGLLAIAAVALAQWLEPYDAALLAAAMLIVPVTLMLLLRGLTQGAGAIIGAQLPGDVLRPALFCLALLGVSATGAMLTPTYGLSLLAAAFAVAAVVAAAWCRFAMPPGEAETPPACSDFRFLPAAAPFLGLSLGTIAMAEAATLLLGLFAEPSDVGIYQPAARLLVLMTVPVQAAAMAFAPRVAELNARGEAEAVVALTRRFTLATTAGTTIVSLPIAITAPWLLALFGDEFASAAPLVWIFAATQILNAASGPVGYLMTMTGRPGSSLRAQIAGLAVILAGGAVLVSLYGAGGAALATALGILVWNGALLRVVRRQLGFDPSLVSAFRRPAGAA